MAEKNIYIYRTYYFNRGWTWVRRALSMIVLNLGVLLLFKHLHYEYQFIQWIIIGLITVYIIIKPKDDLGIDQHYLYHLKTSALKLFTKIDKYKLSDMYSIKCGGVHSDTFELIDFLNGGGNQGGFTNLLQIIFNDNSSISLDIKISRKKLDKIVAVANELRRRKQNKIPEEI